MLKHRLSPEEYEALSESDQAHYEESNKDGEPVYLLQTAEDSKVQTALREERKYRKRAETLLRQFIDLSGDPKEWEALARERVEEIERLEDDLEGLEDGDLEAFREWKASGKGQRGESELRERLTAAEAEGRDLKRQLEKAQAAKADADSERERVKSVNARLVRDRDLAAALDEARITDPVNRKFARGVVLSEGVEVREGLEDLEVVVVRDGVDVPLAEWVLDYAGTTEGKRLVSPPDNSGGGGPDDKSKGSRMSADEILSLKDPIQQLEAALAG